MKSDPFISETCRRDDCETKDCKGKKCHQGHINYSTWKKPDLYLSRFSKWYTSGLIVGPAAKRVSFLCILPIRMQSWAGLCLTTCWRSQGSACRVKRRGTTTSSTGSVLAPLRTSRRSSTLILLTVSRWVGCLGSHGRQGSAFRKTWLTCGILTQIMFGDHQSGNPSAKKEKQRPLLFVSLARNLFLRDYVIRWSQNVLGKGMNNSVSFLTQDTVEFSFYKVLPRECWHMIFWPRICLGFAHSAIIQLIYKLLL